MINRKAQARSDARMPMKTAVSTMLLLSTFCLAGSVHAGIDVAIIAEIRLGKAPPPPPPEIAAVEHTPPKGPPPWAPASGFRRNRAYYYYPAAQVYYRPADRMWIYLEGGGWRAGVSLPASLHIDFDRCVSLTMETDRPYDYQRSIVEYYPADYFAHVRIKEDRDGGRSGDHGPHGKGKAKGKKK